MQDAVAVALVRRPQGSSGSGRARPRPAVDRAAPGASVPSACSRAARSVSRNCDTGLQRDAEQRVDGVADDVGRTLVLLRGVAAGQRRGGPGVDRGDGAG